jgi:hypothetical protein
MIAKARLALLLCGLLALGAAAPASASAAPQPAWRLTLEPYPTHFVPGAKGRYLLMATNVGSAGAAGPTQIEGTLPAGLTLVSAKANSKACSLAGQTFSCEITAATPPGLAILAEVKLEVGSLPDPSTLTAEAEVSGGGASAQTSATTTISSTPPIFGFTAISAPALEEEGGAASLAGSHPYGQTVEVDLPSVDAGGQINAAGHLRDITVDLPRGVLADPAATPVLCTEAELISEGQPGCPEASQVGTITIKTSAEFLLPEFAPLYNMVPTPGSPAIFGFDLLGIFAHVTGELRSDGDYGLSGRVDDILALGGSPVYGSVVEFWGDPSSAAHDRMRGRCNFSVGTEACPTEARQTAFLTMPGDCPGKPLLFGARADSWEEPGNFKEAAYESADLEGGPVSVSGCNQLQFAPTISSQPTTALADSPSGLDFDLHQPQDFDKDRRSSAALRDATVTLPAGMSVNASQADGLGACTLAQIGLSTEVGARPAHFSKDPAGCPDAAKLGTLEVTSPLLAQHDAQHKVVSDPETGEPVPEPLHGSVYLAEPFANPFGSLLAIYLVVEDEKTGIVAKLAGKVIPDPSSGQLSTVVEENPELPLQDVRLHLFGGARSSLITPPTCATHTTTSQLTPWSAPEGVSAFPADSFATSASPDGGSCPGSEAQAANSPSFEAGTIAPQAAAYSPFVLKLARQDGSQRLAGVEATLSPGLSGKLAGIGQCSEAQLAQAASREAPNQGILEKQSPSCPESSRVGAVDVAAGAGPTPLHVGGVAYLAGPYKGAPLSLAIVTPAIADPFDLGAVVVRTALHVDPATAQIQAVSDPIPQILEGIPLDVRSIALKMDRPQFTLNPTSCDPMQITGSALSASGQSAALANPFQVGGCSSLPFKPKLSLRLKGGTKRASHPKLIATLKAKAGEANIAKAQVKLPTSAFLEQAHIRTVCTRVQFAADACPPGSIYGSATATTPLLSDPLSGNVYLRSSNHKLPDLVVALKGPPSLPIEIDLDGKTDSVKGALRNTFEALPDAPVSSFRLQLFGGKRGLVVNSRNLCAHAYKAEVSLEGQNGKTYDTEPAVGTDCGKGRKKGKGHSHGR